MTCLGIWLIATGTCDLLRASRDRVSTAQVWAVAASAALILAALSLMLDPVGPGTLPVIGVSGMGLVVYVVASAAALNHQGERGGAVDRRIALGALCVSLIVLVISSGRAAFEGGLVQRWYDRLAIEALADVPMDVFLLGLGLFLFQISSANIVIRMILDGVGTPARSHERKLKGGRLLGPLERVFIFGLGLAGHVTAASIVIAAKGLIRFPELRSEADVSGASSDLAEYFLVGSFLSWLIAMAGLPLI